MNWISCQFKILIIANYIIKTFWATLPLEKPFGKAFLIPRVWLCGLCTKSYFILNVWGKSFCVWCWCQWTRVSVSCFFSVPCESLLYIAKMFWTVDVKAYFKYLHYISTFPAVGLKSYKSIICFELRDLNFNLFRIAPWDVPSRFQGGLDTKHKLQNKDSNTQHKLKPYKTDNHTYSSSKEHPYIQPHRAIIIMIVPSEKASLQLIIQG